MSRNAFEGSQSFAPVFTAAGHADEGSLKAWVDGQYAPTDMQRVTAHVDACDACQAEVALLRGYGAAASRLLASLDPVRVGAAHVDSGPRSFSSPATSLVAERTVTRARSTARVNRSIGIAASVVAAVGVTSWFALRDARPPARVAPVAVSAPVASAPASSVATSPDSIRPRVAALPTPVLPANPAEATIVGSAAPASATVLLRGTVRDAGTNAPLVSAAVAVTGTTTGTLTDGAGRFTLTAVRPLGGAPLKVQVRRIGYAQASFELRTDQDTLSLDATIAQQMMALQSVVIAAQAEQRTMRMAASATSSIATAPVSNSFSGKGVAGGIARGVERGTESARKASAFRIPRDTARRDPVHGNREQYDKIDDNPFLAVKGNPRSTFSIDVDRASYGNVRRFINDGGAPPPDAVRIEELVNYFPYELETPRGNAPVAITTETMNAPWQPRHKLVRIALQARRIERDALPPSNLVFLIDVSGSMMSADKLPLVKSSLRLLVEQLREQDRVSLVVYAGAAGLVLPSTSGSEKVRILQAIDRLEAGGSTAGGAGIQLAYRTAKESFLPNGNNRVILATDGDFNVGVSSDAEMERLIEEKRADGTYLTVLGFGRGNFQDAKMEKLAKRGNGNYAYVDDIAEARKTLVAEMGATLVTVANDVKLQVEFNPATVSAYRLIGYEDRLLATEDFTDDRKDAGDMGAGHSVTALYEVVPAGVRGTVKVREQDALRYPVPPADDSPARTSRAELAYVKLRYKTPGDSTSVLIANPVSSGRAGEASSDFRFAASVASFGMVLRSSEHRGTSSLESVLEMARDAKGRDVGGYRAEFIGLVEKLADCRKAEKPSCQTRR